MTTKNILVLMGGRSSEHEVSLTSAKSILKNMDRNKFIPVPVLIARDGQWFWLEDASFILENKSKLLSEQTNLKEHGKPCLLDYTYQKRLIHRNGTEICQLDAVFPVLHGPYGEDGTIQGLCKIANLPCVGPGVLGSAVGLDKVVMKDIFLRYGLPVLPYITFTRLEWKTQSELFIDRIKKELKLPVFVKPANCGSSVGITKVKTWENLYSSVENATRFDRKIVVEQGIDVRELECAVLGNEKPMASPVGEILPCREFYDYEAKYLADGSKTEVPANISDEIRKQVQMLAIAAFRTLDCCGMGRMDFFLDKATQKVYINEINTIPGFTSISMYPALWNAAGLNYSNLISRLLELAFEQFQSEQSEVNL